VDDDVKTVAASMLLPITGSMVAQTSQEGLSDLLDTLWACLEGGVDDLGSSVGAVMDLLCELFFFWQVVPSS
jgi:TATA-binding protein-associated factor